MPPFQIKNLCYPGVIRIGFDDGRAAISELKYLICMVQLGGLEPPTSCSTDRRSNQLSYNCILREAPEKGGREWAGN
jgi:hypothetical protein